MQLMRSLIALAPAVAIACSAAPRAAATAAPRLTTAGAQIRLDGERDLRRGDKVLLIVNGERAGSGTFDGHQVQPDAPLDTLQLQRIDSAAVFAGPMARAIYLLDRDQRGVVFLWMSARP
jgi:hypothetical protein